jgi:hypothetical protein
MVLGHFENNLHNMMDDLKGIVIFKKMDLQEIYYESRGWTTTVLDSSYYQLLNIRKKIVESFLSMETPGRLHIHIKKCSQSHIQIA